MTAKRNVVKYICCEEPYPDVTFTLRVKRRSLFYLINLIAPLIILTFLTCMTFIVPFESGERVSLSITVLLSMTVFMLLVQNMIPSTSETIPLIGKFYTAASVEIALAIIISCLNPRLFYTNLIFNRIPLWMKKMITGKRSRWFGVQEKNSALNSNRLSFHGNGVQENEVLMDREDYHTLHCGCNTENIKRKCQQRQITKRLNIDKNGLQNKTINGHLQEIIDYKKCNGLSCEITDQIDEINKGCHCKYSNRKLLDRLQIISKNLRLLLEYEEKSEKINKEQSEWRQVAMAFDRIFFYSFLFLFASTTLLVFSSAPGYVP